MGTVAPIELVWVLLTLGACIVHLLIVLDALHDMRTIRLVGLNGILHRSIQGSVIGAVLLGAAQGCFLIIGLRALLVASPTTSGKPSLEALILIGLLMAGEGLIFAAALVSYGYRRWIRARALEDYSLSSQ